MTDQNKSNIKLNFDEKFTKAHYDNDKQTLEEMKEFVKDFNSEIAHDLISIDKASDDKFTYTERMFLESVRRDSDIPDTITGASLKKENPEEPDEV